MNRVHNLCGPILCLLVFSALPAQQPAASVELPSRPFAIKQSWTIGGTGSWDYLTMDAQADRLYIAHGHSVQVVDVKAGSVVGEIGGLGEAHCIALDDTGEFGYVSDGLGGKVIVFDRRTLATVATVEDIPSPHALVFEPQTRLLFAVRTDPVKTPPAPQQPLTTRHITPRRQPAPPPPADPRAASSITVIDTRSNTALGQILVSGHLGTAQADSRGSLYVAVTDRNQIAAIDTQAAYAMLQRQAQKPAPTVQREALQNQPHKPAVPMHQTEPKPADKSNSWTSLDWTDGQPGQLRSFNAGRQCSDPRGLAVDPAHTRLFVACASMQLAVLNAANGDLVSSLPIGPGVGSIAYDPNRNLIYSANGGADGSLTVIHQDANDSYAVLQILPTRQRARTLAVDPETGLVYLVTDMLGIELGKTGGIGTLTTNPVNGSFSVFVVGN